MSDISQLNLNGISYNFKDASARESLQNLQTTKANQTDLSAANQSIQTVQNNLEALKAAVGSPLTAGSAATMTDTAKIYVYTGSETGYENGHWYYYNGTGWVSGGVYNAAALQTDTTLTVAGTAADAKAAGDFSRRMMEINEDNLFYYTQTETFTRNGLTIRFEEGWMIINGTSTGVVYIPLMGAQTTNDKILPAGTYTRRGYYEGNVSGITVKYGDTSTQQNNWSNNETIAIETPKCLFIRIGSGNTYDNTKLAYGIYATDNAEDLPENYEPRFSAADSAARKAARTVQQLGLLSALDTSGTVTGEVTKLYLTQAGKRYTLVFSDLNNLKRFTVYAFFTDGSSAQTLRRFSDIADNSVKTMTAVIPENCAYIRVYANIRSTGTPWTMTLNVFDGTMPLGASLGQENSPALSEKLSCRIFRKVVCVGDSYTSGYMDLGGGEQRPTNEEYAWPHYMESLTGSRWINCGVSGASVCSWQYYYPTYNGIKFHNTDRTIRGIQAATAAGKVQAYVIGLMQNDTNTQYVDKYVPLGTETDIVNTVADEISPVTVDGILYPGSYYAFMSMLIRKLAALSPEAKIFLNTCPRDNEGVRDFDGYNEALRTLYNRMKNGVDTPAVPNLHLIDLKEYQDDYYRNNIMTGDKINSHYTAIGYEYFAEAYARILSDYIDANIRDFQNVAFIPWDE